MKNVLFTIMMVFLLAAPVFAQNQGYCKSFELCTFEPNDLNAFTVSANEEFVLSTVYVTATGSGTWSLTANENFSIGGKTATANLYQSPQLEKYEFPAGLIVMNAQDILVLNYDTNGCYITVTIIGYFAPAGIESMGSDLTGDGKVNFDDFSVMASDWLKP